MLLLKRHLIDLVRAAEKRQTIRLWKYPRVRAGQIAFTPGLGRLLITAIDEIGSLSALTPADARADGFPTKKSLLAEIRTLYGTPLPKNRRIFRVTFQWPVPPDIPVVRKISILKKPKVQKTIRITKVPRPAHHSGMSEKDRLALRHFILTRAPR